MIYAKARRNFTEIVKLAQRPVSMRTICKKMGSNDKTAYARIRAMMALGIEIKQSTKGTTTFYTLGCTMFEALQIIESQNTDRKSTRAPTALKKPSGAPWFVLTDNCAKCYE
jgi:hypothetical protein